jgi:PAS domain S-box-containing protein
MIHNHDACPFVYRLRWWSIIFALFTATLALLALVGWQWDLGLLKRPFPGLVAMNPVTALGFLLSSLSLLGQVSGEFKGWQKKLGKLLAGIVLLIGVVSLISNRMAVNTAVCFILLSPSLMYTGEALQSRARYTDLAVMAVGLLSLLSLIGYLYGTKEFYAIPSHFPMTIYTAASFFCLALGCLFIHADKGVIREFTSPFTGGLMARRLIPVGIFAPILLGFLGLIGYWRGSLTVESGAALLSTSIIACFVALMWYNARLLNKRDILKQQTEKELLASESRWKSIVNNVKDYAIFLIDPRGNVMTWNEGAASIKGYAPDEIIGRPISVFYTSEEVVRGEPAHNLKMAAQFGRYYSEGWRVRKDGSRFWAEIVFTAIYDEDHRLQAFAKITRDRTDYKLARGKIAYQARLLEDSSDAIVSTDAAFRIVMWNKAAQSLYGYSAEEAGGKIFSDLLRTRAEDGYLEVIRQELREKGYLRREVVLLTKENEARDIALSIAATRDETDILNGYIIVCRDMTERVLTELHLQQFNEMLERQVSEKTTELREIFERVTDAFMAYDKEGNVVYLNKRAAEMNRRRGLDLLGMNIWTALPLEANSAFGEHFRQAMSLQQEQHFEMYSTTVDLWLESHMYPSPNGVSHFYRDITAQRLAQEQLKTSNDELRALASHLQCIREEERYAIAREVHDQLGQQLTGLKMDLSWISKKLQAADAVGVLKKIQTTTQLLDDTIRTVRKIASDLRPGILDDLGLVAAIEWQSEEFEKRSGIRTIFQTEIIAIDPGPVLAIGLFRICQESLTNVARHSGGQNVLITLERDDEQLVLRVADDGKGLDPHRARAGAPESLGLLGMKERALMMGGRLEIRSETGKGLVLTVTVPLTSTHEKINP